MRVVPYPPLADNLALLWKHFEEHRDQFSDELPTDPIHFTGWLAAEDTAMFGVTTDDDRLVGIFIFTAIVPNESCYSHVFIWDREALPHKEMVLAAQVSAAALFKAGIKRINGVTPVTHLHARVFAERVGFKVEGELRKALHVKGERVNAWISGLLPEDLVAAAS